MKFNTSKSMVLRISRARKKMYNDVKLYKVDLHFVSTVKYLGAHVVSANVFKLSFVELQSRFLKSVNSIFHVCKGIVWNSDDALI